MKKLFSILLSFVLLFNFFSISSFAAEPAPVQISSFKVEAYQSTGTSSTNITSDLDISKITSGTYSGLTCYSYPYSLTADYRDLFLSSAFQINLNHEYHLDFKYAFSNSSSATFYVTLLYYDSSDNVIDFQQLYLKENLKSSSVQSVNLNFKPNVSVNQGFTCRLEFSFNQSRVSTQKFYISSSFSFYDKDDNSAVLNAITSGVNDANNKLDALEEQVDGLGNTISDGLSGLGDRISGFFDNLVNSITGLGDRIGDFFTDLKNSFIESITNLGNAILEGLKSLFIPSDDYFDNLINDLKSYFEQKLGILMVPLQIITLIMDLFSNLKTGSGVLHIPDITIFDVTIISRTDFDLGSYFNDFLNKVGKYAYPDVYYVCTDVLIIFMLVNFCRKKYNSITTGVEN